VDRACAAFEQGGEDHRLEENVKGGNADPLKHEVGRKSRALDLGIESDHRDEEEERRKHGQRAGDRSGNHRVAVGHEVAKDR
jgi:hypothetical protein